MMSDCQRRGDPGLACSRFVGSDLAVIKLKKKVRNVPVVKIARGSPVRVGDYFLVFGFGINEDPNAEPFETPDNLQGGGFMVNYMNAGGFYNFTDSPEQESINSFLCSGDSGGAAIKLSESQKKIALVGVNSVGSSLDDGAVCWLEQGENYSGFVDLQSKPSRRFLKTIKGLRYERF